MSLKNMMDSVILAHYLQRIHSPVEQCRSGTNVECLKSRSPLDGFNFFRGRFYPPTVIADDFRERKGNRCAQ